MHRRQVARVAVLGALCALIGALLFPGTLSAQDPDPAVALLGLAALPPSALRGNVGDMVVHRRLELGLIGVAVLASAAIGLGIALLG